MKTTCSFFRVAPVLLAAFGLLACMASSAHAQLVTNGGFEDSDAINGYFSGWTLSGNADYTSAAPNTFVFGNPHSGDLAAWLGAVDDDGFLSQSIATTPGQTYTISYWLAVDSQDSLSGMTSPNDFSATFGGNTLISQTDLPATDSHPDAADDYAHYSFTAVAAGSATELKFGFRDDPSEFRLDDVSVIPSAGPSVPEPAALFSLGLLSALSGGMVLSRRNKSKVRNARETIFGFLSHTIGL